MFLMFGQSHAEIPEKPGFRENAWQLSPACGKAPFVPFSARSGNQPTGSAWVGNRACGARVGTAGQHAPEPLKIDAEPDTKNRSEIRPISARSMPARRTGFGGEASEKISDAGREAGPMCVVKGGGIQFADAPGRRTGANRLLRVI